MYRWEHGRQMGYLVEKSHNHPSLRHLALHRRSQFASLLTHLHPHLMRIAVLLVEVGSGVGKGYLGFRVSPIYHSAEPRYF